MFYCSEFISKENEMNVFPKTIFKFKDFLLSNHMFKPFIVYNFKKINNECINFSDNESNNSEEDDDKDVAVEKEEEDKKIHEMIQEIMNEMINEMMYELDYYMINKQETFIEDDYMLITK